MQKNKSIRTDTLHIDELTSHFKDYPFFSTMDIVAFYREIETSINQATINWRVFRLVDMNILARIGRGRFILGETKLYQPAVSVDLKRVFNKLKKEFPYAEICVWDTKILNEFMDHQPANFNYIIETEREVTQSFFHFLKDLNYPVFIEPSAEILYNYLPANKKAMIIKPLVSEAPTLNVNGIVSISIEKLLVDIFCDDIIFSAQQGTEMRTIFEEALSKYTININKMLRYANRRRKKEAFKAYLNSLQIYGSKVNFAAIL